MQRTNSTFELAILLARFVQGRRCGCPEFLGLVAHSVQFFGKGTGILRLIGAVVYCFVNRDAVQVGKQVSIFRRGTMMIAGSAGFLAGTCWVLHSSSSWDRRVCVVCVSASMTTIRKAFCRLRMACNSLGYFSRTHCSPDWEPCGRGNVVMSRALNCRRRRNRRTNVSVAASSQSNTIRTLIPSVWL